MKLAILPLVKKDGLPEIARTIMDDCKPHFRCFYEEKDTIGKRYSRMDAIGTPFCVTVDHQTKKIIQLLFATGIPCNRKEFRQIK